MANKINFTSLIKCTPPSLLGGVIFLLGGIIGCAELNDPGYGSGYYGRDRGGYYDDGYYGRDDYRRHRDWERHRDERRDIDRERDRLEDERRRLEEERRRRDYHPPASSVPRRETCPPGFSPSERKCTSEERKHGCKDVRLPGGLGCVHR